MLPTAKGALVFSIPNIYHMIDSKGTGELTDASAIKWNQRKYKARDGKEITDTTITVWTNTYRKKTRVFATTLGHNNETVADARYLDLVARGLLWSVDKLNETYLKPAKKVMIED